MRHRLFRIVLAGLLIGGAAGMASAASHGGTSQTQPQKPSAEKAAKPATAKTGRHVGAVKAVDPAGKTVTVEEKSGDVSVSITEKTAIKRGKDAVKLEDLKTGDRVTVVYTQQNGKDVARSVLVKAQ